MTWHNAPIGMVRHDELLNGLLALWMSGAHEPTLNLVAQNYGLLDHFEAAKRRRIAPPVVVSLPCLAPLLTAPGEVSP